MYALYDDDASSLKGEHMEYPDEKFIVIPFLTEKELLEAFEKCRNDEKWFLFDWQIINLNESFMLVVRMITK